MYCLPMLGNQLETAQGARYLSPPPWLLLPTVTCIHTVTNVQGGPKKPDCFLTVWYTEHYMWELQSSKNSSVFWPILYLSQKRAQKRVHLGVILSVFCHEIISIMTIVTFKKPTVTSAETQIVWVTKLRQQSSLMVHLLW